jgi:uncharacterized protein
MSETEQVLVAQANFPTLVPRRYLGQLCKHFEHRVPVVLGELTGKIAFPAGVCDLEADAGAGVLRMRVTAGDAAGLAEVEGVVERHLLRFAFREPAEVVWG